MSNKFIENLQKRLVPKWLLTKPADFSKLTVQAFTSAWHRTSNVWLSQWCTRCQRPSQSRLCSQPQGLRKPKATSGHSRARSDYRQASRAHLDAALWLAACLTGASLSTPPIANTPWLFQAMYSIASLRKLCPMRSGFAISPISVRGAAGCTLQPCWTCIREKLWAGP